MSKEIDIIKSLKTIEDLLKIINLENKRLKNKMEKK
jgi:hypothetical protein